MSAEEISTAEHRDRSFRERLEEERAKGVMQAARISQLQERLEEARKVGMSQASKLHGLHDLINAQRESLSLLNSKLDQVRRIAEKPV